MKRRVVGMGFKKTETRAVRFIRGYFAKAKRKTAIVGLSGGLDSAVVLSLCVRALGSKRVLAVLLPSDSTPKADLKDAHSLAKKLGVRRLSSNIGPAIDVFGELGAGRLLRANLSARIRMAILYSIAQKENGLVVGTGDKSEFLLGYFTKHGDGGADLFPIGGLYKTQVRELAAHLGVPAQIISKPSSPALWSGQTAEKELGFSYETADAILSGIEKRQSRAALEKKYGKKTAGAIFARMAANRHKIVPAPICKF